MVLVDTSIWVDHLRRTNAALQMLLLRGQVLSHPFVIGELACGNLANREEVIALLNALPSAAVVADTRVVRFIALNRLSGKGLSYIDMHLLAACENSPASLWTRDKQLAKAAASLGLAATNS